MGKPFTSVENVQFSGQYLAQSKLLSLYGLGYCEEFKTVRGWLAPSEPGQLMAADPTRLDGVMGVSSATRKLRDRGSIGEKSPLHSKCLWPGF
jgi:hypothetical protein